MGVKSINKPETNVCELEILLENDAVKAEVSKVYKKNAGKFNVPGFRKGKAPRNVIEKYYGSEVFLSDAIENLANPIYAEAIKENSLDVVSAPELKIVSRDEEGVNITITFYVRPEAVVTDYKGLPAVRNSVSVSEEEILKDMESIRKRNARVSTLETGVAENDDEVTIDFEGFVDGVAFEGGKGEKYDLKLGSKSFIPGFEDQIIGHSIGESFDVNVTFPENYGAEKLAGAAATFKVFIHAIKRTELPALDDDFAKDVSEFDTFEEYKKSVSDKLLANKEHAQDHSVEEQIIDELIAKTVVEIPACMIDDEIDAQLREMEYNLKMQGITLEMYCQYLNTSIEQLRENSRARAERQVKATLALAAVVKAENVEVSDEDIDAEFEKYVAEYGVELETVKASFPRERMIPDLAARKALKLLVDLAVVTVKEESAEDKADTDGNE